MNKEEARSLYEKDISNGFSIAEAKERLAHYAKTGIALPDPTGKHWDALVHKESRGKQSAVSPKGATGVAQVMPATGPEAAALAGAPWDPVAFKQDAAYNARLGRAYFRKQLQDNNGDPALALAAYNAGPGAVRKAGGDLDKLPAETQDYVPSIMNRADEGMQPDLDDPAEVAQAQEALMSPRDRARKVYEDVLANGGSPEEAKAAIAQFVTPKATPTAQGAPQAAPQGTPVQAPAPSEDPTFAQGLQNDIEKIYQTDPVTAGMGRSLAGMIQGTRKLYNQTVGDEDKVKELEADEQRTRDFWSSVDPEGSGFSKGDFGKLVGDVTAGGALGKVLKGGILGNAAAGAVQGALQPTTANDSQALNAGVGALVGGGVGAVGKGITSLVGKTDPSRIAAGDALRTQGVDVPPGQDYNSPIGAALRKMGGDKGSLPMPEESLTRELAKRLGMQGDDITNSTLEQNLRRSGKAIGDLSVGKNATPDREFVKDIIEIGRKYHQSGPVKSGDPVISMADHLLELSKGGRALSGEEYQALRTGLSANSVTGSAAEKQAMGSMKRSLDAMFNKQNPSPERGELNSQYRLSQILRKGSGIPADGMTAKQLRNRIEGAANKGEVDPAVRGLLDQTNMILPKAKIGGDAAQGAGDDVVIRGLDRPGLVAGLMAMTRGVAGPASKFYDKGFIQSFINNKPARASLANLLRGGVIPQATRLEQGEQ